MNIIYQKHMCQKAYPNTYSLKVKKEMTIDMKKLI